MSSEYVLLCLLFSPFIGILVLFFLPKQAEKMIKIVGIAATLPSLLLSVYIFLQYQAGQSLSNYHLAYDWFQIGHFKEYDSNLYAVRFELGVDGLSLVMLVMTTLLTTLSAIASLYVKKEWKGYFLLFLLLQVGMLGVFTAGNLLLFFLFFEMTLVPMFFLIGKWGYAKKEKAAYSFLIYNGLGSAVLLIVIMILFAKTGTSNIAALQQIIPHGGVTTGSIISDQLKAGLLLSLIIAFGVKLPIFPLHSWMLRVHAQAPTPLVMLHAGVLLKIGAYGMIQFGMGIFPEQFKEIAYYLIIAGVINFLYGAFLAFVQTDFKMVLAYSSISHMGIVIIGIGVLNEAGLQGAIFQVVSHGLIAALLFFLVGIIYEREHTSQIETLRGMTKRMPIIAGFLLTVGLASLGLPGMSGFVSEFMVFLGLFQGYPVLGAIAAFGLMMTVVYVLRAVLTITFGESKQSSTDDVRPREWIPLLVLTGLIVMIGVYPALLTEVLKESIQLMLLRIGG